MARKKKEPTEAPEQHIPAAEKLAATADALEESNDKVGTFASVHTFSDATDPVEVQAVQPNVIDDLLLIQPRVDAMVVSIESDIVRHNLTAVSSAIDKLRNVLAQEHHWDRTWVREEEA